MSAISERLQTIHERIERAAVKAGRKAETIDLLAVSKTYPADTVREALEAGQTLFGENKVQEILAKQPELSSKARWHLIGHLQSNKVRKVLPLVDAIHSVDSVALARDLHRIGEELGLHPKVYLEINLAQESTKYGFTPTQIREQLDALYESDRLYIQGLMCIPPFAPEPEQSRRYFATLRQLRDELEKAGGAPLPHLSMGMSHDFEVAIEEGATIVRVGSAIFGERAPKA